MVILSLKYLRILDLHIKQEKNGISNLKERRSWMFPRTSSFGIIVDITGGHAAGIRDITFSSMPEMSS